MNTLRDSFAVEKLRARLAEDRNYSELFKTYSSRYPEITDQNTPQLWDSLNMSATNHMSGQNPMAEHRIAIVASKIVGKDTKVLDVGFGSAGLEKKYFAKQRNDVEWHGIDISQESVTHAQRLFPQGHFKTGTITSLNYSDNTFDYVIALEVLEHIPPRKTLTALRELKRVLKPSGTVILSVPMNEGLEEMVLSGRNPNAHTRMYTRALILAELQHVGFIVLNDQVLYAFDKHYYLKSFIAKIGFQARWLPNNIIVQSAKR